MGEFQALSKTHDRLTFDCSVPALNEFLKRTARQHQVKGISRTFVLVDSQSAEPTRIEGFFTSAACHASSNELPEVLAKGYPRTIPGILLGRLTVDVRFQGRGLGSILLAEVIHQVVEVSQRIGVAGLYVDAKDADAASFYERHHFLPLPSNAHRLFLPLEWLLTTLPD